MQKPAKRLFKFSGPTDYALQNLRDGMIFCQHYAAYNDPFEYWARIVEGIPDPERESERFIAAVRAWGFDVKTIAEAKAEPLIWDNVDEYFDECQRYAPPFEVMRENMRIACFGSEQDNLLMWSHYGDGLRGFCVVFDEDLITNVEPKSYLLDVAYLEAPPKVDSFIHVRWLRIHCRCSTSFRSVQTAIRSHKRGRRRIRSRNCKICRARTGDGICLLEVADQLPIRDRPSISVEGANAAKQPHGLGLTPNDKPWQHFSATIDPSAQFLTGRSPVPLVDPSPQCRSLQPPRAKR